MLNKQIQADIYQKRKKNQEKQKKAKKNRWDEGGRLGDVNT